MSAAPIFRDAGFGKNQIGPLLGERPFILGDIDPLWLGRRIPGGPRGATVRAFSTPNVIERGFLWRVLVHDKSLCDIVSRREIVDPHAFRSIWLGNMKFQTR